MVMGVTPTALQASGIITRAWLLGCEASSVTKIWFSARAWATSTESAVGEELGDSGLRVREPRSRHPGAHARHARREGGARRIEERRVIRGPRRKVVAEPHEFGLDRIDAPHVPGGHLAFEVRPEAGADVEPVVPLLRFDEDVRVEDVGHSAGTPRRDAQVLNVSVF